MAKKIAFKDLPCWARDAIADNTAGAFLMTNNNHPLKERTNTMLAFYGVQEMKDRYLAAVRSHNASATDAWWHGVSGKIICPDSEVYELALGIPRAVPCLIHRICWGLPKEKQSDYLELVLSAIRPGADLADIYRQFAAWILADSHEGVIRFVNTEACRNAISGVAQLLGAQCTHTDVWRKAAHEVGEVMSALSRSPYPVPAEIASPQRGTHAMWVARLALDVARSVAETMAGAPYWSDVSLKAVDTESGWADTNQDSASVYARHFEKLLELLRAA